MAEGGAHARQRTTQKQADNRRVRMHVPKAVSRLRTVRIGTSKCGFTFQHGQRLIGIVCGGEATQSRLHEICVIMHGYDRFRSAERERTSAVTPTAMCMRKIED